MQAMHKTELGFGHAPSESRQAGPPYGTAQQPGHGTRKPAIAVTAIRRRHADSASATWAAATSTDFSAAAALLRSRVASSRGLLACAELLPVHLACAARPRAAARPRSERRGRGGPRGVVAVYHELQSLRRRPGARPRPRCPVPGRNPRPPLGAAGPPRGPVAERRVAGIAGGAGPAVGDEGHLALQQVAQRGAAHHRRRRGLPRRHRAAAPFSASAQAPVRRAARGVRRGSAASAGEGEVEGGEQVLVAGGAVGAAGRAVAPGPAGPGR